MSKHKSMGTLDRLFPGLVLEEHDGLKFHLREKSSDIVVFRDNVVNNPFLKHSITAAGKWLDLGGYIGTAAAVLMRNGADLVVSVEADPVHVLLYNHNMQINGYVPIVLCAGVTDAGNLVQDFYVNDRGGDTELSVSMNSFNNRWKTDRPIIPVLTIAFEELLDWLFTAYGADDWSVKFDIEGSELEILSTCDLSMFNQLYIEYHFNINKRIDAAVAIVDRLKDFGFNVVLSRSLPKNKETWDWWPNMLTMWCVKNGTL